MIGFAAKAALLIVLTHGLRGLGRLVGPRRGGLILGLPCSTALVLVSCGHEQGMVDATEMAEASLVGLVGAVALPLAYAWSLRWGWQLVSATVASILTYVALAWGFSLLPMLGAVECLGIATFAVLVACVAAGRIPMAPGERVRRAPSRLRCLALRTVVPVLCLAVVSSLRLCAGPWWAGLLCPFPGMTLAVLIVTHMEAGPLEARRMARALPQGNWGMIAFLVAFRLGSPVLGLARATAIGYALAAAVLLAIEAFSRRPPIARPSIRPEPRQVTIGVPRPIMARRPMASSRPRGRRPGPPRRLSPLVEPIGL